MCWWCRERPATTGEHKFKATDLRRLMGCSDELIWGDDSAQQSIRGKKGIKRDRYGVIKFPKSLCAPCNNERSQSFDRAYDDFATFIVSKRPRSAAGISLEGIYGASWPEDSLNLARYYVKHFGCRFVRNGIPVPSAMRAFLNGADDMPDVHLGLVTVDEVHVSPYSKGLSMSPDIVINDVDDNRIKGYAMAAYIGPVGVRFEWNVKLLQDEPPSQFFHFPRPVINTFKTQDDMFRGITRRHGRWARFTQWVQAPSSEDLKEYRRSLG